MRHITGLCLAVALSWSVGAAAQGTAGTQDTATPATETDRATTGAHDHQTDAEARERTEAARTTDERRGNGETITAVGCIQRERDVFATRGMFNDDVVMTQAVITQGRQAFDRLLERHQAMAAGAQPPYDAERDERRDDVVVQHDGTDEADRAVGTAGVEVDHDRADADRDRADADRDRADADRDTAADRDVADRDADHTAGVTGATGTAGTYGGDRDADRDRTRTDETAADAEALTRDDDRHEATGTAGVAADRPTGAYDADRDGEGTTARFENGQGTFNLTGDRQADLQGKVGRQVEVTGTVSFEGEVMAGSTGFEAQRQAPVATPGTVAGEIRHDTPGQDEARATSTGGGWVNPDEVEAAAGRDRLAQKPVIEVTSFRDIGPCEPE